MNDGQSIGAFTALSHKVRLDVWRMLLPYGQQGLSAGDIAARLSILPSSLSFHLRQMNFAGVLIQRRYSRQIIYAVNPEAVEALIALFATLTTYNGSTLGQASNFIYNR